MVTSAEGGDGWDTKAQGGDLGGHEEDGRAVVSRGESPGVRTSIEWGGDTICERCFGCYTQENGSGLDMGWQIMYAAKMPNPSG